MSPRGEPASAAWLTTTNLASLRAGRSNSPGHIPGFPARDAPAHTHSGPSPYTFHREWVPLTLVHTHDTVRILQAEALMQGTGGEEHPRLPNMASVAYMYKCGQPLLKATTKGVKAREGHHSP